MDEPENAIELLEKELLIEDDVLQFAFLVAGNRIECIPNFTLSKQELYPTRLHLEGNAKNLVGRPSLWQVARQLGHYFNVQIVRIEGGRRTTGRYKGKLPTPFISTISKS